MRWVAVPDVHIDKSAGKINDAVAIVIVQVNAFGAFNRDGIGAFCLLQLNRV